MTRNPMPRHAAAMLALAALACSTGASAQTAAKPAAKPAATQPAKAEGKTLSFGSGTGKVMTREELRSCLQRQTTLSTRRDEAEAGLAPLNAEKEALVRDQDAMKAEMAKVDAAKAQMATLNDRYKAYGDRVEKFNMRMKESEQVQGFAGDKLRRELESERQALAKLAPELEAERVRVNDGAQATINAYNERAKALDQRVTDWNQRNAAQTSRARTVNVDRDTWTSECADRRYREDDEIAIRKGE